MWDVLLVVGQIDIVVLQACNMAKLYWRVKRDGKWTYVAFSPLNTLPTNKTTSGWKYSEEEE